MQRVVRSSLVGLLTIAGLAACGDKVTLPAPVNPTSGTVVHSVVVSPSSLTLNVGGTGTLAASVDADAGVTNRGVTWSSSDATIASVGTDGKVTALKAGTATVIAASAADPTVRGAAAVTVIGAGTTTPPTVTISSINNNFNGLPANLTAAAGQLDVILNVDTNGQPLRSVSATFTCPNGTTLTQSQTITAAPLGSDVGADEAAAPVVLSFNTAKFDPITGIPSLRNGTCSLTATATTGAAGATPQTQTATLANGLVLANADGVLISETFAPYTNAEGVTTKTTANDQGGLPWRGGAVTVTALPVLYSGRSIIGAPASLTITLHPGATSGVSTITPTAAGAVTATFSATATSGLRTTGQTLVGAGFEINGITPLGFTPTVQAIDVNGTDLNLVVLNFVQPCGAAVFPICALAQGAPNPTFRLDNSAVQPPSFFSTPGRQVGWVNGSYTFVGPGGASFSSATGTTKYVSCGDGANNANASGGGYTCTSTAGADQVGQIGVSAGVVSSSSTSATGGTNGLTTFTFYSLPTASYTAINTNGTSTSATTCSITGWKKIATAGELDETLVNTAYIVRVFETDLLGNARCTDMAANANVTPNINTGAFNPGKFGVDKTPPTATYAEAATDPTAASNLGALAAGGSIANFNIKIGLSDNASGFSGLPINTVATRLAVNPATGLPSNSAGNFNNTFGCPSGLSNGACGTAASTSQTLPGWYSAAAGALLDGTTAAPGCAGCGYYTFSQTPLDLARNAAATIIGTAGTPIAGASFVNFAGYRTVVIDQQAPVVGGIAVPATLTGGAGGATFSTNANDNLDLISSDFTLRYPIAPCNDPIANLPIRAAGPSIGVAFDATLTTTAAINATVPFFIRTMAVTSCGTDAPANNGQRPDQIQIRAYDAASNASAPGTSAINPANVPLPGTGQTNYVTNVSGGNPLATMINFKVSNVAANISNCVGCTAVNPTTIVLTATSDGNEGATYQYLNPFSQVQFYYYDTVTTEWILIGFVVAPVVTDNATVTVRTFTWTLPAFDPPIALGAGTTLKVIAVGVNGVGDGLSTGVNANITLTNP